MDTSGPGNVIFGYAMEKWKPIIEELIASWKQGENDNTSGWFYDFPDDRRQRQLGCEIVERNAISAESIADLAWEIDIF